jgi:hypothetical protein
MMTRRAWFLGSDLAGVATAMITHKGRARAPIRPSPARHRVTPEDFADPLGLIQLRMLAVQVSDYRVEALCHFVRAADHGNVAGDV